MYLKWKEVLLMLYYIDKDWYHFRVVFKICFSRSYSPSQVTRQKYFGNFNLQTSVRLHHWCSVFAFSLISMEALVKSCNICWVWSGMLGISKVLQNNKATKSLGRVELFCLFVACSYTPQEATVLSWCFSWVWFSMPKVFWSNKSPISLERVKWFCWFFASSYLCLGRYPLKLQKYAILGWHRQA